MQQKAGFISRFYYAQNYITKAEYDAEANGITGQLCGFFFDSLRPMKGLFYFLLNAASDNYLILFSNHNFFVTILKYFVTQLAEIIVIVM
jgi:hypothetical protein